MSKSQIENLPNNGVTDAEFPGHHHFTGGKQLHFAVFLPDLSGGGAERAMLNLAIGLKNKGYGVDLLLAKARGPYLEQVPKDINIIDFNSSGAMNATLKLIAYLRRVKPTGMTSALTQANVAAVWAKMLAGVDTRFVLSTQNMLSIEAKRNSLKLRIMPFFVRSYFRYADLITGVSAGVTEDLIEVANVTRERTAVLYNPVVTDDLLFKASAPVDHPWFEPGQPPVILTIGRLNYQKDHVMLLQAFGKALKQRPDARLLILGEGDERQNLEKTAAQIGLRLGVDGNVLLPGFVGNPYAYLARAAIFVLSSRFEGLPTVLIEALACGASVISTDCPSGPQEILLGGKFGALVPVGDADAMSNAIAKALTIGRKPNPESWKRFTQESATDRYIEAMCGHTSAVYS